MHTRSTSGRLAFACAVVLWSTAAAAQPSILGSSGQWSQKGTVTVSGAGFGSKTTAAPAVWDDASGADPSAKWDAAWPNCTGNDAFNLAYRTPSAVGRNIPLPHNHITKYLAGAHYGPSPGPECSYAVIMYKVRTITSFPAYSYASWYQRSDDGWHFGGDDNYKTFAYSAGVGPYNLPNNWYMEYNPRPISPTSGATWHLNDDALGTSTQSLQTPDQNGHSFYWGDAVNPMGGQWSKIELEAKYTNENDGYIKLWENGVLKVDYRGKTDSLPGSTRTEGIGGYAANYPYTSNWRYFADVYLDYSRARVILGNAPTLDASTIREVQVPTHWSDSSIDVTVNLGRFGDEQTAYLYVVNENGAVNPAGIPITTMPGVFADTILPTVSLLQPAGGSVSGVVSVEASASDNVGVAGVQLLVDGVATGNEDTSAPYVIDWNSATSVNGAHQITALARDAAGNVAISAAVIVTAENASAPTTTGLIASYSFDQRWGLILQDDSGHGHDGTLQGGPTWIADDHDGAALLFDGIDDTIVIPDDGTLNVRTGVTIEARVNPSALGGYRNAILKGRPAAAGLSYGLYVNNNTPNPAVTINTGGGDLEAPGASAVPLNTWTHLTATYDGAILKLFVDGALTGSRPASGLLASSTGALTIGGNEIWGEFFAGAIDDVRVYNRALSEAEIAVDVATPVIPPAAATTLGSITYQGSGVRKATFDVTDVTAAYALRVSGVDVTAGLVTLNGRVVMWPHDFHGAVNEVPIRPRRGSNEIVVRFSARRGSPVTIGIVRGAAPTLPPNPAPHVRITSPAATAMLTEGATIPITVAASGNAVRRVDLIVNGVVIGSADDEAPRFLFTVPMGVNWLNLQARATDAAGRTASTSDMIVTVVADARTTVRGYIEDTAGRRIAGADVGVALHGLSAEIFKFNTTLSALPSLTGRTPDTVKVISAANLLNPNAVFGIDPFGFGQRSHAIRLTGSLRVTKPGTYTFVLGVTEGGRLTMGGSTVLNVTRGTGVFQQVSAKVWLPAGSIPIEVRTFDNGNPQIQLSYAPPGRALKVIPQSVLTPAFTPFHARSGTLGVFSIGGVPAALGDLEVDAASTPARGRTLEGDAGPVTPVAGGVTDIGAVRVH